MRIFLKQVMRFGLIGCGLAAVIFLVHAFIFFRLCERGLRLPDGVNTLVFGHSHAERSVNPALFPGCMNMAQSMEGYDINLMKMRVVLKANPGRVKRVVVPLAYHSFFESNSNSLTKVSWELEKKRRYAFIEYMQTGGASTFDWSLIITPWLYPSKKSLCVIMRYLLGSNTWSAALPYIGGYRRSYSSMLTPKMLSGELARVTNSARPLDPSTFVSIETILVEGAQMGAQVHLVFFPVHPDYQAAIPVALEQQIKNAVRELVEKHGGYLHDFTGLSLDDRCYQDYTHLNAYGSDVFSPLFYKTLCETSR